MNLGFCYKNIIHLFKLKCSLLKLFSLLGRTCEGFPGPGYEVGLVANPMKEFIYPEDQSHLSSMYDDFIDKYDKKEVNENPDLISTKKHTFNHNLRFAIVFLRQSFHNAVTQCSNPACSEFEICDGEILRQWSRLKISLNTFVGQSFRISSSSPSIHHNETFSIRFNIFFPYSFSNASTCFMPLFSFYIL